MAGVGGPDAGRADGGSGTDAVDTACDLLLAEDLRPNQVTPGPAHGSLGPFLVHPVSMVGTDSTFVGAKPSPRTWGSFPRILGEFVRDQRLMPLEEAVRKMTSAPAARLGIPDRGHPSGRDARRHRGVRPGHGAVHRHLRGATLVPGGPALRGRQRPAGRRSGSHTGALPGRALRRGRSD